MRGFRLFGIMLASLFLAALPPAKGAGKHPHRRVAAADWPARQERPGKLGGDADCPRHDQRARRDQRPQGRIPARRRQHAERGDQRDRTPDHQGWHQDHHRLVRIAHCDRGEPGRRNVTAFFIGKRRARPRSSRAVASSTPSRSVRPRANTARLPSTSSSMILPSGSTSRFDALKIALLWENRAFGKSVGDGIRAYYAGQGQSSSLTTKVTTRPRPT